MKIILASGSPRRKELLGCFFKEMEIIKPDIDETFDPAFSPEEAVKLISLKKALAVKEKTGSELPIIAADTIVVIDNTILGKPASPSDAFRMIKLLSGKEHYVFTGFTISYKEETISKTVSTKVIFKKLTDEEIDGYIKTGEPFDKAGAYAIQGIGAFMVEKIDGSHSNVIGLPVKEVIDTFQQMKILKGMDS